MSLRYYIQYWHKIFVFLFFSLAFFSCYSFAAEMINENSYNGYTKKTSYSFVVWGHPRNGFGEPPLHFEEILKLFSELKPDLIFITGDVVEGGNLLYLRNKKTPHEKADLETINKDWDRFQAEMDKLNIPYYISPGNHDIYNIKTRDIFISRFKKVPFSLKFKDSLFILLDSTGIHNIGTDDEAFTGEAKPFTGAQIEFIKKELERQNDYSHIFFFMHNTKQWAYSDGFWWRDIHPLLTGGRTRAVFSGNPDGYKFKYAYRICDKIYYIQSCTYPVYSPSSTAKSIPNRKAMAKQLDNIQLVKVDGDDLKIETIPVGALSAKGVNRAYWEKVEEFDKGRRTQITLLSKSKKIIAKNTTKIFAFLLISIVGNVFFLVYVTKILFRKKR